MFNRRSLQKHGGNAVAYALAQPSVDGIPGAMRICGVGERTVQRWLQAECIGLAVPCARLAAAAGMPVSLLAGDTGTEAPMG